MGSFLNKRNWWIAPVVAGILSIAVTLIQQKWLPDYGLAALVILGVLLGAPSIGYIPLIGRNSGGRKSPRWQ